MIFLIIIGFICYFVIPYRILSWWLFEHDNIIFGYEVDYNFAIGTLITIQTAFFGQLIYWIFM